jgi:tetratricopeptide (TPR) repeat protein
MRAVFAVLAFAALLKAQPSETALLSELRLHPNSFEPNHLLGEFYIQQHQNERAAHYLEKAYQLDSANYVNAYDLALLYLQLKAPEKSRAIVDKLIAQSDKAELHNLLGDVEDAEGHFDNAGKQYEFAARLDASEKNLFDLGTYLLDHRGFDPALKVFVYGAGRYPQSARLRVGLGVAYYSVGRYDEAVEALCQAVDLDPQDAKPYDFLGKMYDVSPAYAEAVEARLERFVHSHPDSSLANYYYGLSLRKRSSGDGNAAAAEPYLLKAVRFAPGFTDAHFELGLLYEDLHVNLKAIAQYEIAIQQRPDSLKAHYRLAQLYSKEGQRALAQRELSAVAALKAKATVP